MKIKNQQAALLDGLRVLDGLVLFASGWVAHVWRFAWGDGGSSNLTPMHVHLLLLGALAGLMGSTLMVRDWHHTGLWGPMRDAIRSKRG